MSLSNNGPFGLTPPPAGPAAMGDVVERLLEGFQIIDRSFRYVHVNRALLEHARRSRADLIGHRMREVFPGIEETPLYATIERCMRERTAAEFETPFVYPDGDVAWFELRITPIPEGLAVLSLDITDRKALAARLQRSQRLEVAGRMAANIGHEFKNLLTAVQSACELAQLRSPAGAPIRDDLDLALAATERASELAHQLLSFCRQRPIEPRVVDLAELLDTIAPLARRVLGRRHHLVTHLAAVAPVWLDVGAIEQVVLNLVQNAGHAMPDGGEITLRLDERVLDEAPADLDPAPDRHGAVADRNLDAAPLLHGRYVSLSVTDTGLGMTPDVLAHVFEPFFTTKDTDHGTGLGLSICYGIVRQAGGAIRVASKPGHGTTFTVYLPAHLGA